MAVILKSPKMVLGIDPGLDGGLGWLTLDDRYVNAIPMPVVKIGKKRQIDRWRLVEFLRVLGPQYIQCCVIEEVHAMPKQGVTSMFTFGMGYGVVLGVLAGLDIHVNPVAPVTWKNVVLSNTKKDKDAAIHWC